MRAFPFALSSLACAAALALPAAAQAQLSCNLGLSYAITESLSSSAIWSGANTDRAGQAGTGRLVLGLTQSF